MDIAALRALIDSEPSNAEATDAEVLAWLASPVDVLRPIASRTLLRWGAVGGRLDRLSAAQTAGATEVVRAIARAAVLMVAREDTELDLADANHEGLVDALVSAGTLTAADKTALLALATATLPRASAAGIAGPVYLGHVEQARRLA